MNKNRLESFSDGVFAILITIMVLEINVPNSYEWIDLKPLIPVLISYLLSFIHIGIYWGNHHHLLKYISSGSTGNTGIIWANHNLLFWLSLIPFVTLWMGESNFSSNTISLYAIILLTNSLSFNILLKVIKRGTENKESLKKGFIIMNYKGIFTIISYLLAIVFAYIYPVISIIIFFVSHIIWIPEPHIKKSLENETI